MNTAVIYNMGSNNTDYSEISTGTSHENPAGNTDTCLYEVIVATNEFQHSKMENVNVYENFAEDHKYVQCIQENLENPLKAITEKCNEEQPSEKYGTYFLNYFSRQCHAYYSSNLRTWITSICFHLLYHISKTLAFN